MNSEQINVILKKVMRSNFHGVFPSDRIPPVVGPFPYGLVINTDKAGQSGRHWQALWITGPKKIEFFDSFGDDPRGAIKLFLDEFNIIKNRSKVQANYEVSCGPFVIYYLINRYRGVKMEDIVRRLYRKNFVDSFVKFYVHSLIKV